MDTVQVGTLTHFVLERGPRKGEHRPAIITRVSDSTVKTVALFVFFAEGDYHYFRGWWQARGRGLGFGLVTGAPYSDQHESGSWHFIE